MYSKFSSVQFFFQIFLYFIESWYFQVYDKLRKDQPNFRNKLYPINGDICQPGLGVSQADREILEKNVHIVFHSAATVRFDAPLR